MKYLLWCLLALSSLSSAQCLVSLPTAIDGVTLYGEVNMESASHLIADIQAANASQSNDPIYLYINSPGGEILAGNMIVDAIAASRRPIYTVDVGLAASMAAYIHSYGAKRYMAPRAVLMFHRASMPGGDDISHLTEQLSVISRIVEEYERHLAEITKLSVADIEARENVQWWLLASDAQKYHLIDGIINPSKYPTH